MSGTFSSRPGQLVGAIAARAAGVASDEEGQALVEYALILGLVVVLAVAGLQAIGTSVTSMLQTVVNDFP